MNELSGFDKYTFAVTEAFMGILDGAVEERKDHIMETVIADLSGTVCPKLPPPKLDENEEFLLVLFNGLTEIHHSQDALLDAEVYVRRFPYSGTRLSRIRHLRRSIETFLQEVYILKMRVLRHLIIIKKHYRRTRRAIEIERTLDPLYSWIKDSLENAINARDAHVHDTRFTTPELDRLDSIEFRKSIGVYGKLQKLADFQVENQYKIARREWTKAIKEMNISITKLLDQLFSKLYPVIFNSDGHPLLLSVYY